MPFQRKSITHRGRLQRGGSKISQPKRSKKKKKVEPKKCGGFWRGSVVKGEFGFERAANRKKVIYRRVSLGYMKRIQEVSSFR